MFKLFILDYCSIGKSDPAVLIGNWSDTDIKLQKYFLSSATIILRQVQKEQNLEEHTKTLNRRRELYFNLNA